MSRTKKGSKPPGFDFGSRLNCDKHYSGSYGPYSKYLARKERRNTDKKVIRNELKAESLY